jgi:hypothetical protein
MSTEIIKFKLTEIEARLVTALLDHCRSGIRNDDTDTEFKVALRNLQDKFDAYREDGDSDRVAFTRERFDGSKKTYRCNSKSFVTIEVE